MVRRAYTQRSLVEVLLPDADKLWDPRSAGSIRCSTTTSSSIASPRPWPAAARRAAAVAG
jgi:hypothetical protein